MFGFSALSKIIPNTPNPFSKSVKGVSYGRVVDIILDENHPLFEQNGEWGSIGVIFYKSVGFSVTSIPSTKGQKAFPYFPNFKHYPLIGEIVPLIALPNVEISENATSTSIYYLPPTNIWNTTHQNAQPVAISKPTTQRKTIFQTQLGSPNISGQESNISLGKTFKEKNNIHSLQPYEGDVIIEGRWGNTIRLGSTVKNQNPWSNEGTDGDPIIILKAGSNPDNTEEAWIPEKENVDKDSSSIYMTSQQQIPIKNSLSDYSSYTSDSPTPPDQYNKNQVLINSGRLMFNANQDHIVLSSNLTVSFNAGKGYNFDTPGHFVVKTGTTVRLGDKQAPHPLLKGDITISILSDMVTEMIKFTSLFQSVPTPGLEGVKAAAGILVPKLTKIKAELETKTKSSKTFTK